jgi:hypothetical protein
MKFDNEIGYTMRKRVLQALTEVLGSGKDLRLDDDFTVSDRLDMNLPVIHHFDVARTVCRKGYRYEMQTWSDDPGQLNDPAVRFTIEVEMRDQITLKIATIVEVVGEQEKYDRVVEAREIYKMASRQAEAAQSTLEAARLALSALGEDVYDDQAR